MFTISSNLFRMQEWSNLARDNVSRLRPSLPLVSFFDRLVGAKQIISALKMETACFSKTLVSTNQSTWCLTPEHHHQNTLIRFQKSI
jgi:streptomycin 6-kinase